MREKKIIQTSMIAIMTNLFLVFFKMSIGLMANSLSIILDAVNNLSDALSSIITIGGTSLSKKRRIKNTHMVMAVMNILRLWLWLLSFYM